MPVIERPRKSLAPAGALAAILLAAVLLSACGGTASETGSTAPSASREPVEPRGLTAENSGTPGGPGVGQKPKSSPDQPKQTDPNPQPRPAQQQSSAPGKRRIPGCPPGLSDQVCRETADAKSRQEESPPQASEKKRCPASLSRAECQALASDPTTKAPMAESAPGECPPALTAAQCAELEARDAEATK